MRTKWCVIHEDNLFFERERAPLPDLHHAEGRFAAGYDGASSVVNQICQRPFVIVLLFHRLGKGVMSCNSNL